MPRCNDAIQHTAYITRLSLYIIIAVSANSIFPVACSKLNKENVLKETQATDDEINNQATRRMNDIMSLRLGNQVDHTYLYSVSPLTKVYKLSHSHRPLQKAHDLDSSFLRWKNRKLLFYNRHMDGSDFEETHKHRSGHSKIFKKRFARLKSNVKVKEKTGNTVRRSVLVDPVQRDTLNFTLDSNGFLKKLNFSAYKSFLHDLNLSRRVALDAERAFLCIVFITLAIMAAVWAAGMCRVRRHSPWNVLDFESSQPLTTVKDAILRKSKYLPMFADYYRNQDKRRKNLFLEC